MKPLSIKKLTEYSQAELIQGDPEQKITRIVHDSREVKAGDLFIALVGKNDDGHKYLGDVIAQKAGAVIVDSRLKLSFPAGLAVLKVDNTTAALQKIAHNYRQQFANLKVVAITGSAGKTTTKDLTAAVLAEKFEVLKTAGNYNNQIGLPLTLLQLTGKEDFAVLEMGMSGLGEIALLAEIACPEIGVITNVGAAHLEQLGSLANIAKAKAELLAALPVTGTGVLNYDNKYCRQLGDDFKHEIVSFGFETDLGLDIEALDYKPNQAGTGIEFSVKYQNKIAKLTLNKPGRHNVYNALAAVAVGLKAGLNLSQIRQGLKKASFSELRLEILETSGQVKLINDSYNANPLSMQAAINVLSQSSAERRIAVLGSMLELGEQSSAAHFKLGQYLAKQPLAFLVTLGKKAAVIGDGAVKAGFSAEKVLNFSVQKELIIYLKKYLKTGDLVLIKGSRENKMEKIAEALLEGQKL
ncbi:UDP-N-acetylmuramoyl-tripeptide--D-alanyl-D-alanine ligase [Halanaerobium salsuginis]|uniref:UDP-N-acetylmuramoyl-tripeptide--D-alanyl-D-alanine ligase n=1 Tax=Halanaerobium salsuginis TaxID=29563 RepID=A0A1I4GGY5_9FIRM|nr:UDP-N-acetylmuramoyl-tripeptide--D-alanyl-D-alanine ligase [Halanaerobium salsuginis]SFL28451.1 UDP-N-acetylmuramoyl-tripeptide--D-alanyl-D-alanine ligase [Halanaerobium salsuginis]